MKFSAKKAFLPLALIFVASMASAQNVQLHYDFGKERQFLTSTVEMFKPDDWGSTFFFIDMDYDVEDVSGISLAYWEIARDFQFWDAPFTLHAEFNGGLGQFAITDTTKGAYNINNMWLGGLTYSFNSKDFSKGITLQAMYKYIRDKSHPSYQLTAIWYVHMLDKKLSFLGFADFWREDNVIDDEKTEYVFLSEPQLWYNFTQHLSVGSEVEFGYNFGNIKGFKIMPTVGARWNF